VNDVILEPSQKTVNGGYVQKMDGWIPIHKTEGSGSLSSYSLTNTDLVLIPGKPRSMSYYFKFMHLLLFLSTCAFKFTGVDWNLSCMILGTYA